MTKKMIPARTWTEIPGFGRVLYGGDHATAIEIADDGRITFGKKEDGFRFLVKFGTEPPVVLPAGETTSITFNTVPVSSESLAPDQEDGQ